MPNAPSAATAARTRRARALPLRALPFYGRVDAPRASQVWWSTDCVEFDFIKWVMPKAPAP
eukprot:1965257-Pleurochrysis_carterae.AAC.4